MSSEAACGSETHWEVGQVSVGPILEGPTETLLRTNPALVMEIWHRLTRPKLTINMSPNTQERREVWLHAVNDSKV